MSILWLNEVTEIKWNPEISKSVTSPLLYGSNPIIKIGFTMQVQMQRINHFSLMLNEITISKGYFEKAKAEVEVSIDHVSFSRKIQTVDWVSDLCLLKNTEITSQSGFNFVNLPIKCKITWLGQSEAENNLSVLNLNHHLLNYYMQKDFSDITLVTEDEEIPAHKIILASQSPVFLAMFKSDMKESFENKIKIDGVSFNTMKEVLKFLYTGKILEDLNIDVVSDILRVSDMYEISDLKHYCERLLIKNLSKDNVCMIIDSADKFQCNLLFNAAMSFMVRNKRIIIDMKEYENLYKSNPKIMYLFSCNALKVYS